MLTKLKNAINHLAGTPAREQLTPEEAELYAAWDSELAKATSARDRAEIDAIFARSTAAQR
jgi:hypothetical protein